MQDKTISPDKGQQGGSCNRTACQQPHTAFCYNATMQAYYCIRCARRINESMLLCEIPANYNQLVREAHQKSS